MNRAWTLLELLRHHNIRVVVENSLVTAYLHDQVLTANIDNYWTLYTPVMSGEVGFNHLLRGIQAGIAVRGNPYAV